MDLRNLHSDFRSEWITNMLSSPGVEPIDQVPRKYKGDTVTNNMFEYTLYTERGIKARISFRRPCKEADASNGMEECFLMSLGDGLDGARGRSHGGFNSLILDQISGALAHHTAPNPNPPATATITVDFKAPISTPCVMLCRAWVVETSGRKIWVKAVLEDSRGRPCSTSKALFISAKPAML